jgi:galactokinase
MIGGHTDYNDGWALPAALDMGTDVAVRRQTHGLLRVLAPRLDAKDERPSTTFNPAQVPNGPTTSAGPRRCYATPATTSTAPT